MNNKTLGKNNIITFIKYILLSVIIGNIINTLFKVIENKFAINENANTLDYGNYNDLSFSSLESSADAHIALTFLIVLTPICLFFVWWKMKLANESGNKNENYMTPLAKVFNWAFVWISSFAVLSVLILSVYILIGGKSTQVGQLQVLTILAVFGSLLYYAAMMIKNNFEDKSAVMARKVSLILLIAGVLISLVLGFMYANPKESIKRAADQERLNILIDNNKEVSYYLTKNGNIPKGLDGFKDDYYFKIKDKDGRKIDYKFVSSDLSAEKVVDQSCLKKEAYYGYPFAVAEEYCTDLVLSGSAEYQICATFDLDKPKLKSDSDFKIVGDNLYTWNYKSGYSCYTQKIETENGKFKNFDYSTTSYYDEY